MSEHLTMSERTWIGWWRLRSLLRRCPTCGTRGYDPDSPSWSDDKTAQMLGIAYFGCPMCGHGAIEERDRGTCRSWCVEANHPGREHGEPQ